MTNRRLLFQGERRVRREGAYIVRAAESRPTRVPAKFGPRPPVVVTDADRALVRAVMAWKAR